MVKNVVIPAGIAVEGRNYLLACDYELTVIESSDTTALFSAAHTCDAILTRSEKITAELLENTTRLKVIAKHGIGLDNIDVERASSLGIQVVNAPEANIDSVVEHTLLLMLAVSKHLLDGHAAMIAGDFNARERIPSIELHGKLLGVVGYGHIGRKVAAAANAAFGMSVLAYDPYLAANQTDSYSQVKFAASLEQLFSEADFISLHIPHIPQTEGLVNAHYLSLMKPSGILINTARGRIVDETALIKALKSKSIAGAGMDVYVHEPVDPGNALLSLPNVVLTPHNAALTTEARVRMAVHAAQGIHEVLSGRVPTWPVNLVPLTRKG